MLCTSPRFSRRGNYFIPAFSTENLLLNLVKFRALEQDLFLYKNRKKKNQASSIDYEEFTGTLRII